MRHGAWILAGWLAAGASADHGAYADDALERFTATAVDLGAAGRARAGTVDITIERWSTDEERSRLVAALREGGSDALLDELQDIEEPAGYIRTPTSLRYPLQFARQVPLPGGGRRILIATDRPVSFLELRNQGRTLDYPFLVVDIRLAADGEGEGRLLPLASIQAHDDNVIEVENYATQPVRLTQVRKVS